MKYLKFIENHKSGSFMKDDCIQIPATSLDAWIESGTVEEIKKKEFDKWTKEKAANIDDASKKASADHYEKNQKRADENQKLADKKKADQKKIDDAAAAAADESNEDEEEDMGNGEATGNDSNDGSEDESNDSNNGGDGSAQNTDVNNEDSPSYYTLTKNDMEQNVELVDGFTEGDEIEVDQNGIWLLGEDEKLIAKV